MARCLTPARSTSATSTPPPETWKPTVPDATPPDTCAPAPTNIDKPVRLRTSSESVLLLCVVNANVPAAAATPATVNDPVPPALVVDAVRPEIVAGTVQLCGSDIQS